MNRTTWKGFSYIVDVMNAEEQAAAVTVLRKIDYEHQAYGPRARANGFAGEGRIMKRGYFQFGVAYHHTGWKLDGAPSIPKTFKDLIEAHETILPAGWRYNQCVAMHYPAGTNLGWHVDGQRFGASIAGLSFGVPGIMQFRRKGREEVEYEVCLEPGSAYILSGELRWDYEHQVLRLDGERFNLTFRCIGWDASMSNSGGSCDRDAVAAKFRPMTISGKRIEDIIESTGKGLLTYEQNLAQQLIGEQPTAEQTQHLIALLKSDASVPEYHSRLMQLCASTDVSFETAFGSIVAATNDVTDEELGEFRTLYPDLRLTAQGLWGLRLVARLPRLARIYMDELSRRPNRFVSIFNTEPADDQKDVSCPKDLDCRTSDLSYVDMIFRVGLGRSLTEDERNVINGALVAGAEPGSAAASAMVMDLMAAEGAKPRQIYQGFLSTFGFFHLGAISECAAILNEVRAANDVGLFLDQYLGKLLGPNGRRTGRVPGFGHGHHRRDPRAALLLAWCEKSIPGGFIAIARWLNDELLLRRIGAINMDGVGAAMALQMGFPHYIASMFTLIARTPRITLGLCHVGKRSTLSGVSASETDLAS